LRNARQQNFSYICGHVVTWSGPYHAVMFASAGELDAVRTFPARIFGPPALQTLWWSQALCWRSQLSICRRPPGTSGGDVQLRDLRSSQSITAITLRHPGLGLSISIRGVRPGWWADLGEQIDLTQCRVSEVTVGVDRPPETAPLGPVMPTAVNLRAEAIARYCATCRCAIKELAARADVHPRDLRRWRNGGIADSSVMSARIERLLQLGVRSDQ
jgi:hypothetical protein